MSTVLLSVLADAWDMDGHMGGGWWIVMTIWLVLFGGAIIIGIVWLIRGSPSAWRQDSRMETPLETLDRRFAEGAISADEYVKRRTLMTGGDSKQSAEPPEAARQ